MSVTRFRETSFGRRPWFRVRSPGFEPGSSAWEADVLAKLDYDRMNRGLNDGVFGHVFALDQLDQYQPY